MNVETLRFLATKDCRELLDNYFGDGMGPAEAAKYNKEVLQMKLDFQPSHLTNAIDFCYLNPLWSLHSLCQYEVVVLQKASWRRLYVVLRNVFAPC
ncbi:hypothetical protein HNY73_005860 [Argiope bruennichi]|uniref:Uncharacterized protein n=1 Tax=Argiope bruennichi TaxID=94029 RepID=A0A8T0FKL7_ARGBR|nr:hypothetical protein HNY73_005860 [Argiope bruennichi]